MSKVGYVGVWWWVKGGPVGIVGGYTCRGGEKLTDEKTWMDDHGHWNYKTHSGFGFTSL